MIYFSPGQLKVLKSCWMLALLAVVHHILLVNYHESGIRPYLSAGWAILLFSWEFFFRGEYKKGGLFIVLSAVLYSLFMLVYKTLQIPVPGQWFSGWQLFYTGVTMFALLTLRGILWRQQFAVKAALIMLFTWYYGSGALSGFADIVQTLFFRWDMVYDISQKVFYTLVGLDMFLSPFIFYTIVYVVENYLQHPSFRQQFHSKVRVIHAREYLFLFILLFSVLMSGCMGLIHMAQAVAYLDDITGTYNSDQIPGATAYILLHTPALLAMIGLSGYLLRNVMVSRSLTIGLHNGFMYFLHFVPLLNILPMAIYASRKEVHTQPLENAEAYIRREPSALANWIIVFGILISLFGLYQAFNMYDGLEYRHPDSMAWKFTVVLLILFQFARIVNYFMLRNYRNAVYVLFVFNIVSILILLIGTKEIVAVRIGVCYLSVFLLQEIFHPTLFGHDAEILSVAEKKEDAHTA